MKKLIVIISLMFAAKLGDGFIVVDAPPPEKKIVMIESGLIFIAQNEAINENHPHR